MIRKPVPAAHDGDAPVASVIVPSYRGVDRLPLLLDSLAAQQSGTPAFEVIVVIDGVDDGSVAVLERENRLDVRPFVFPENRGRVAALNAGFEAAKGWVLIRCDDDLVPRADYVSNHVKAHENSRCGVVGLYLNVFEHTDYARVYGQDADARHRKGAYASEPELRWRYWAGNCSITRESWNLIGPYDADYRLYGWEDIDFGYRLQDADIEVKIARDLETPHRVAAVTTAIRAQRAVHAAAARRLFETKHPESGLPIPSASNSPWNFAVRASSRITGRYPRQTGAIVDGLLRFAPAWVGTKLVALVVESAAAGGYRHPSSAKEVF